MNMKSYLSLLILSVLLFCFACQAKHTQDITNAENTTVAMGYDTLSTWIEWAESSDVGLWSGEKRVYLEYVSEITGEDDGNYFSPTAVSIRNNRLYITDRTANRVTCIDSKSGLSIWALGESGEGPGCFSMPGRIVASDSALYISNMGNGRVDIISLDGKYVDGIPIQWPHDLEIIGDSILIVTSLSTSSMINIYDADTGTFIKAFGRWETKHESNIIHAPSNLLTCMVGDSLLGVASCFESTIRIFNIHTEEMVAEFSRNLPFDPSGGRENATYEILDIFTMDDSLLCVLLPQRVSWEKEMLGEDNYEEMAEVTICDRYSSKGEYLDSFVFPLCCETVAVEENVIVVNDPYMSSLVEFRVLEREY